MDIPRQTSVWRLPVTMTDVKMCDTTSGYPCDLCERHECSSLSPLGVDSETCLNTVKVRPSSFFGDWIKTAKQTDGRVVESALLEVIQSRKDTK